MSDARSGAEPEPSWDAELERRGAALRDRARNQRWDRVDRVSRDAALWLAVAPAWTAELAEACGLPAAPGADAQATLDGLVDAGVASAAPSWRLAEPSEYTMPRPVRREILGRELQQSDGRARITAAITAAAKGIREANAKGMEGPAVTGDWAALLADGPLPSAVGAALLRAVDERIAVDRPNEAVAWIEAARPLEEALGGAVTVAVLQAGRAVELHHRRADDRRRIDGYFEREGLARAFRALIESGDDAPWALHFLGPGGSGKTMLMRHIGAELAGDAATARVDFDHISPDYPSRQPWLLLALLSDELRLHDRDRQGRTAREFAHFDESVIKLEERYRAGALTNVSADVAELVGKFVDAIAKLPQPVVLLLDTCEELERRATGAGLPPNVTAMQDVLEQVHAAQRRRKHRPLRVVFCGRRPLAAGGAGGWTWVDAPAGAPRKDYLRLVEVGGFSRDEAEGLVRRRAGGDAVDAGVLEAILRKSPAPGCAARVTWEGAHASVEAGYSPFELGLFADWLRDDGALTPAQIEQAGALQYVELRIVGRVSEAVRELIPAAAAARSFDRAMLAAAVGLPEAAFDAAYQRLLRAEWVQPSEPGFHEIEERLRERIVRWATERRAGSYEAARRALADHLERHTLEGPRAELSRSHVQAAIALLVDEPARALGWWGRLEARLVAEGSFDWLVDLGDPARATAAMRAGGDGARLFCAAIKATYSAAAHQLGRAASALWDEVLEEAVGDAAEAVALRRRAVAGALAAAYARGAALEAGHVGALFEALAALDEVDEAAAGALVSGAEAVVERAEAGAIVLPDEGARAVARLADRIAAQGLSDELRAFSGLLAVRAGIAAGFALDEARLDEALHLAGALSSPTGRRWLDWLAPEDVRSRVCACAVLASYPAFEDPASLLQRLERHQLIQIVPGSEVQLDQDRHESALAVLRGALAVPDADWIGIDVLAIDAVVPQATRAAVGAHRLLPPLSAAMGLLLAAVRGPREALDRVRAWRRRAVQLSVLDEDRALARAEVSIVRRYRLEDDARAMALSLDVGPGLEGYELRCALLGLSTADSRVDREPAPEPGTSTERWARWHARWRASLGRSEPPEDVGPPEPGSLVAVQVEIDRVEARLLVSRPSSPTDFVPAVAAAAAWMGANPRRVDEAATLALRLGALTGQRDDEALARLCQRLGRRRLAQLAQDEGELLALRLPRQAIPLLAEAGVWCAETGDPSGAYLAAATLAMAGARAGDRDQVREALRTAERYTPELPDAQAGEWQPWRRRILACAAWLTPDDATAVDEGRRLPPELAGWKAASSETGTGVVEPHGVVETILRPAQAVLAIRSALADALTLRMPAPDARFVITLRLPWSDDTVLALVPWSLSEGEASLDALPPESGLHALRDALHEHVARSPEVPVALLPQGSAAALCWEELVARLGFEGLGPIDVARFYPRRGLASDASPRRGFTLGPAPIVQSVVSSSTQYEMAWQAFSPLESGGAHVSIGEAHGRLESDGAGGGASVVHLVVQAFEATSGVYVTAAEEGTRDLAGVRGLHEQLDAGELGRRFGSAKLFLLQAVPTSGYGWSAVDRLQAAYLRLVAAQLHGYVPAVVTIPPLPADLASSVLHALASAVLAEPTAETLVRAAAGVRADLVTRAAELGFSPDEALMLAMDLCVHADG